MNSRTHPLSIFSSAGLFAVLLFHGSSRPPAMAQVGGGLSLDGAFPGAFGRVGPVRELSDGRVMVADPLGQVVVLIDFESGLADTLGHWGEGPQEYRQPDGVFELGGDTTLLVDLGNARLRKIGPDGTFLETRPMSQTTSSGSLVVALPRSVDRVGRLYFLSELQPMGSFPDSAALLRLDPRRGELDTLAFLKVPELPPPPLPGGGGSKGKAAEAQDDWAASAEGQVVIVRCGDYSVTWISPEGQVTRGPPNRTERVRIRDAEREMWLEENTTSQVTMRADVSGTVSVFRSGADRATAAVNRYEWPSVLPVVKAGRTVISPDREAWVERYVAAGASPLVDRFDQGGRKVGELRLPQGRRVGGFGKAAVFLVHTDEYGLQWIERYRLER